MLGVETDGRQFHSDRREFEEDRRRWNLLTVRGVPILRATRKLLFEDPRQFIVLRHPKPPRYFCTRVRTS